MLRLTYEWKPYIFPEESTETQGVSEEKGKA
jgi:hypothetical protein